MNWVEEGLLPAGKRRDHRRLERRVYAQLANVVKELQAVQAAWVEGPLTARGLISVEDDARLDDALELLGVVRAMVSEFTAHGPPGHHSMFAEVEALEEATGKNQRGA